MRESTALIAGVGIYCFTRPYFAKHNNEKTADAAAFITALCGTAATYAALVTLTWFLGLAYTTTKNIHEFSKDPTITPEAAIFASSATALLLWKQISRNGLNSPKSPKKIAYF